MKILLIDNFHYRRGGAEVVYLNTGNILQLHGHEVVYFSQKWPNNISCDQSKFFPSGIDVKTARGCKRIKCIINYFYNFDAARKLKKIILKEKPDIAHIHLFWGGLSASILNVLKKNNIPVVHTVHDYRMVCPAYAFKNGKSEICEKCHLWHYFNCIRGKCSKNNLLMSILMTLEMYFRNLFFNPTKYISSFIFVSNFSKNKHIEHDKRFASTRNVVLYNFSNSDIINFAKSGISSSNYNYYLFYGRLSYEKGIETLIEAFSIHQDKNLKIVGTGPLESLLKEKCKKLQLKNIDFVGYKTGSELYSLVCNAKFVCVPSECYENNPMTIIESYTLGTPVIGAAIGGITEIILNDKTGYTFIAGDIDSLAKTIDIADKMKQDSYYCMKANAKQFAEENFNINNYYNALIKLYEEII